MTDEMIDTMAPNESDEPLSLTEELRRRGFTHKQTPKALNVPAGSHDIRRQDNPGVVIFQGDAAAVWEWINEGCQHEQPAEAPPESGLEGALQDDEAAELDPLDNLDDEID